MTRDQPSQAARDERPRVDVSLLLRNLSRDEQAPGELFELVYNELHGMASRCMRGERPDHSLQPTVLVHEAWLRLGGNDQVGWQGRGHFFGAAGQAMRRILVDHARSRQRGKRGGGLRRLPLDALELVRQDDAAAVLAVDEVVERLEVHDPRLAEVVRLRFWAGLDERSIAGLLGLSLRTVQRDWLLARAWLTRELEG